MTKPINIHNTQHGKPPLLKVLVCSANLGNADPSKSFSLWIPRDGCCLLSPVTGNNKDDAVTDHNTNNNNDDDDDDDGDGAHDHNEDEDCHRRYDLIVVGMQEAVWDASGNSSSKNSSSNNDNQNEANTTQQQQQQEQKQQQEGDKQATTTKDNNNGAAAAAAASPLHPPPIVRKAVKTVGKVAILLSNSRDHTLRAKDTIALGLTPDGTSVLHQLFRDRLPSYRRLLSYQRGEMRLFMYAPLGSNNREHHQHHHQHHHRNGNNHHFQLLSVTAQNTGKAGLANKGGIAAQVCVNRTTTISFMTCHLEAHEGIDKYRMRCASFEKILDGTAAAPATAAIRQQPAKVGSGGGRGGRGNGVLDISQSSHCTFVFGDLNFRTRYQGRIGVKEQGALVRQLLINRNEQQQEEEEEDRRKWDELYAADELSGLALKHQHCLAGFETPDGSHFPPTFKVERRPGYSYLDNRTPSYTDRILYKTTMTDHNDDDDDHHHHHTQKKKIRVLLYEPIPDFETSDHKPIRGAFEVELNHPLAFRKKEMIRSLGLFKHPPIERKHLHLFVSDIQCDIFPRETTGDRMGATPSSNHNNKPSTYVCLVSSPEEILYAPPTKFQQCYHAFQKKYQCFRTSATAGDAAVRHVSVKGWPRTTVQENSWNPEWNHEQHIQCILRRHYKQDGQPIPLGGAMLHIFLFQTNNRQPDQVIGSYPVNLESLYRSVGKKPTDALQPSNQNNHPYTIIEDDNSIVDIDVNGPLLKNGMQRGFLRCTLHAWWVDETLGGGGRDPDGNSFHLNRGNANSCSNLQEDSSEDSRHSNQQDSDQEEEAAVAAGSAMKRHGQQKRETLKNATPPSPLPLLIHTNAPIDKVGYPFEKSA